MKINESRLAQVFQTMCEIDSPSRREGRMAQFLEALFRADFPEAVLRKDSSELQTGSETGNLVVHFPGVLPGPPIFFTCHMDTVEPGCGVKVIRRGSRFFSSGDTILGGDDKAGIAILIEAMRYLKESGLPHLPVDLVFTTCEEIGLLGAKALDVSLLKAGMGYALDSTGVDLVITGAPAAVHFTCTITGAAAHAGLHPERGINAIQLAGKAVAELPLGRLDDESTANIGLISGGKATNIVPETVRFDGEVRSHSPAKLKAHTHAILGSIRAAVADWTPPANSRLATGVRPGLEIEVSDEYPAMHLDCTEPVVTRVAKAAQSLGRPLQYLRAGGGSDANILNGKGFASAIIGIGMDHVHSTEESIDLNDMLRTTELIVSILTC
ncbi:M20/M25/M40 family metallo-hydrolase [Thiovibrio sp. JS02]